jgi:hypothetical protein
MSDKKFLKYAVIFFVALIVFFALVAKFATPDDGNTQCVHIGSNPCVPVIEHSK